MNEKKKRLDILKQLIASNTASNQEDILSMLAEKGFVVTQATLSRDLKELKVAKTPDGKADITINCLKSTPRICLNNLTCDMPQ